MVAPRRELETFGRKDIAALAGDWLRPRLEMYGRAFLIDALVVATAYLAALVARFDAVVPAADLRAFLIALPFVMAAYAVTIYLFSVHRRAWKYADIADVRALAIACVTAGTCVLLADVMSTEKRLIPISVAVVGTIFAFVGLLLVRVGPRLVARQNVQTLPAAKSIRVLIVGAGQAGQIVVADLLANPDMPEYAVGFLDDDPHIQRRSIGGLPVLGTIDQLPDIVRDHDVDAIAVAIPSAPTREIDRILALALETDARIQILPSQAEAVAGRIDAFRLRDINLDSLLDRIPSNGGWQDTLSREYLAGRVVLVTGAAGSIGSELCRQLVFLRPAKVVALDNNETGLFHLSQEFESMPNGDLLEPVLTSVTAGPKLERIFDRYRPDVVFHAAAYKHVHLLEDNVDEAVFVNVKGTLNVCQAAARHDCERVIFVSTDKAVRPVSVLGFSKRVGELLARAHHGSSRTIFCCVRFGNVIGSRGSALPEFIRQIDNGGPVTVTHPDVERYFMTIPEASSLVIQAGALARGGEVFMLDMGQPIRIGDLVKRLVRLRGLRIGKDIEIIYTGLRPGEKMTEDLHFDAEDVQRTQIPGILSMEDGLPLSLPGIKRDVNLLCQAATYGEPAALQQHLALIARGGSLVTAGGSVGPVAAAN